MSEVLQYLRTSGPATAQEIRHALGLSHEAVYTHLVAAEAKGLVRVFPEWSRGNCNPPRREWEVL